MIIKFLKLIAFLLLIIVGYHYANQSLGFTHYECISIVILSICLFSLYDSYHVNKKNVFGWLLIFFGCFVISRFSELSFWILIPIVVTFFGFSLAELSVGRHRRVGIGSPYYEGSGSDNDYCGGSDGGGGGDCGGGD